jgi:hypothetical protein
MKNKKIFYGILLCCLTIITSCIGSSFVVNASSFTYSATVVENSNQLMVNGIKDIESFSTAVSFAYKFTYTPTYDTTFFRFIGSSTSSSSYSGDLFIFNHNGNVLAQRNLYNVILSCETSSTGITLAPNSSSGSTTRKITLKGNNTYTVYLGTGLGSFYNIKQGRFINRPMLYGSNSLYGIWCNVTHSNYNNFTTDNLNYLVDFNPDTNFSLNVDTLYSGQYINGNTLNGSIGNYNFQTFYNKYNSVTSDIQFSYSNYSTLGYGELLDGSTNKINSTSTWYNCTELYFNKPFISNLTLELCFGEFDFNIYRPFYRFNNTLSIYNYDYLGLLSSAYAVNYSLTRGSDYYNISYINYDGLPNYKNLLFSCEEIKNTLFDDYIDLHIYVSNSNSLGSVDFTTLNNTKFSFGFDFNFDEYLKPLVVDNGVFDNFQIQRPDYVEMKFSLSPLYLPILEILQNSFVYFVYDFPIFKDLLAILGFDNIVSLIYSIMQFILYVLNLGDFLTGLIAFFVCIGFIRLLVPVSYSAVGSLADFSSSPAFVELRKSNKKNKSKRKIKKYNKKANKKLNNNSYEQPMAIKHYYNLQAYGMSSSKAREHTIKLFGKNAFDNFKEV